MSQPDNGPGAGRQRTGEFAPPPVTSGAAVSQLVDAIAKAKGEARVHLDGQLAAGVEAGALTGTLLLTDMVATARYFELHGEGAGRRMLQRNADLLRPIIERHQGAVLAAEGDAVLAVLPDPARAVEAAVALQQAVTEAHAQITREEDRLRIRVGLHHGPIRFTDVTDDGGSGLLDSLSITARIERQAQAGQILVSDAVRAGAPSSIPLANRGQLTLRPPDEATSVHEVIWRQMARPDEDLPRVDARYIVQSRLGSGGMASVWRARDERLGRDVAIKVLHRNLPFSSSMRERLQREARVAAALVHENVVQVYDVVAPESGDSYIAMELVEGRTLRDCVEKTGPLPSWPATLIAYEVARGVGFAHARGVVHRDVKPDNVLISDRGAVKVGDFGIAVMDELVRLTASGVPVGTPAYLAPEQVKGERADTRSDVFAFGVLLYEICTGKLPFTGGSPSAVMYKIVEGDYVPPEQHVLLEPELSHVIRKCLRRNPDDRFQNVGEIVEALRPVLQRWLVVDPRATLAQYVQEGNLLRGRGDAHSDSVPTVGTPKLRPPRPRKALRRIATVAGVALLAGGIGVIAGRTAAPSAGDPPPAVVVSPQVAAPENPPEAAPPPAEVASPRLEAEAPVAPPAVAKTRRPPVRSPAAPPVVEPARAEAPPPAPGTVRVVLQGGWADILVDGKPRGRSPPVRTLSLPAGEHQLEFRNPHRAPHRETVTVPPGGEVLVRAELKPVETQ